jgi:hypothetical protein
MRGMRMSINATSGLVVLALTALTAGAGLLSAVARRG